MTVATLSRKSEKSATKECGKLNIVIAAADRKNGETTQWHSIRSLSSSRNNNLEKILRHPPRLLVPSRPFLPFFNHFKVHEIELNPLVSFVFQESCRRRPTAPRGLRGREERRQTEGSGEVGKRSLGTSQPPNQPASQSDDLAQTAASP